MIRGIIELPLDIVEDVRAYMMGLTKNMNDKNFDTVIDNDLNIKLLIEPIDSLNSISLTIYANRGSYIETTKYTISSFSNFLNVFRFKVVNELVLIELIPKGFVKTSNFYNNCMKILQRAKTKTQLINWIDYKSFTNKAEFFELIYTLLHNQNILLSEEALREHLKEKLEYYGYDEVYYKYNIENLEKSLYVISDNILDKLLLYLLRVLYENKECQLTNDTYAKLFKRFYKLLVVEDYIEE